jgi:hypothetical protein
MPIATISSARGDESAACSMLTLRHSDNAFSIRPMALARSSTGMRVGERRFSTAAELSRPFGSRVEGVVSLSALEVHGRTAICGMTPRYLGFYAYRALGRCAAAGRGA